MRILHVASGREWRGGQRQTLLLARGLAVRGIDQRLLTRRGSELARRARADAISVVPVSWSAGLDPRALVRLVRAARDATVLHAHDSHAVALTAAASAFTGRPFVATRRMTRPLRNPRPWRRAGRVIAISAAVRDALVRSGLSAEAIAEIPPAIDVGATARARAASWVGVAPIPPGAFVVIAVSALTQEKGIDLLVEALGTPDLASAGVHGVIAGQGPDAGALELQASAGPHPGRVHFLGQVNDPLPLIAASQALVMPSREEAFGSTILDALALGVPVIGTRAGGIPEALAHGGGVLVPPGDSVALARQILRLREDPTLRAGLSQEGRTAARHFDLEGMVNGTLAVYRSVMENVDRQ